MQSLCQIPVLQALQRSTVQRPLTFSSCLPTSAHLQLLHLLVHPSSFCLLLTVSVLFFYHTEIRIQGLTLARQAFYHLSHSASPIILPPKSQIYTFLLPSSHCPTSELFLIFFFFMASWPHCLPFFSSSTQQLAGSFHIANGVTPLLKTFRAPIRYCS
jgi:hypothetical protein